MKYWVYFFVLCSKSFLVIYFSDSNYSQTPDLLNASSSITSYVILKLLIYSSSTFIFVNHKFLFCVCGSISVFYIILFVSFFKVPHFKQSHLIFVFLWLTTFNMKISVSIYVAANGITLFFYGWAIFHCIYLI